MSRSSPGETFQRQYSMGLRQFRSRILGAWTTLRHHSINVCRNALHASSSNLLFLAFYLIMDLAVGGTNGWFPDNIGNKPWLDQSQSTFHKIDGNISELIVHKLISGYV